MIYFELYPGDYLRDTSQLSLLEHGAYLRLLMAYYAEEEPLSGAASDLYVIAGATSAADKAAVRKVADRYFPVSEDGLRYNSRVDGEIAKAALRMEGSKDRKAEKKGNETERQRRTRARRIQLFSDLRDVGIVPDGMTSMAELRRLHVTHVTGNERVTIDSMSRVTDRDMSRVNMGVNTGNQTPDPILTPDTSLQASEIPEGFTATGWASVLMRRAGCHTASASHPDLIAAVEVEGVPFQMLVDLVEEGRARAPPPKSLFIWAVAAARGRHAEGAKPVNLSNGSSHRTHRLSPAERTAQLALEGELADAASFAGTGHGYANALGVDG